MPGTRTYVTPVALKRVRLLLGVDRQMLVMLAILPTVLIVAKQFIYGFIGLGLAWIGAKIATTRDPHALAMLIAQQKYAKPLYSPSVMPAPETQNPPLRILEEEKQSL